MNTHVEKLRKINPRQKSNFISKFTFWYTLPMFIKGFKKELKEKDLYKIIPDYCSQLLGDEIENEWEKRKTKHFSMFLLTWTLFGKYYFLLGLTKIINIAVNVARPIVIGKLVSFFVPGQKEVVRTELYLYCTILIGLNLIDTLYRQNYYLASEQLSIKLRSSVCSLIFRKILNQSVGHSRYINFGKITSMITRDVSAFDYFFYMFNESWTGFVSTIIICYNMYEKIGSPVFILVSAYVVFIFCGVLTGMKMASLKLKTSEKTDERLDALREFLSRIRCTKMYVWENFAEKKISKARKEEMDIMLDFYAVVFLLFGLANLLHYVTHYLVIMTCFWTGQVLTAEILYFITSGFQSIYFNVVVAIPFSSYMASQVCSALKRLQSLIKDLDVELPPISNDVSGTTKPEIAAIKASININNKFTLKDFSFNIDRGLTILTGPGSSGKTVLLLTILKEYAITKGSLYTKGRLSYASQEPWLFPATIKQNIIFGADYNQQRYREVIKACDLEYDFDLLQKSDLTIVAEEGINLSKGQQSRICLARAVYRESDIYLIDDCFSSLDPLVAQSVFSKCILKHLKDKLVVVVSNNSNFSKCADNIINLNYKKLVVLKNLPSVDTNIQNESTNVSSDIKEEDIEDNNINSKTKLIKEQTPTKKIYEEFNKAGSVSRNIYGKYIQVGGGKISIIAVCGAFFLGQVFISYKDILISDWANIEEMINVYNKSNSNSTIQDLVHQRNFTRHMYTFAIVALALSITFRGYVLSLFSKVVSVNLHKRMLRSVIHATMNFFDQNFIGNIVNRFSKDIVVIDETIPITLLHILAIFCETAGTLTMIALVSIQFLIPIAVLVSSLILLRYCYLRTGRALKRLEPTTKIPIVGYINAVLKGLPTIRAFNAKEILKTDFKRHLDLYISSCLSDLFCLRAYVFVVDNIITLFVIVVMLKFVIFDENALPGDVGLAISQSFVTSNMLYFGFCKWAELETLMTSAERAFDYTNIQQETKTGSVLERWPKFGEIQYENVFLSLNNCKSYVLKNINFVIKPAEKICIVGRTGAGKSSILSTLFRLYQFEGNIKIDGIDIKTLSLEFLRSKISVIPQDSIILNGSVRDNIDPEKKHSDEKIWEVLETVKLKTMFLSLEKQILETETTFAQQQLLCLARVLLAQNKILLLDEITENGDTCTENLVYDIVDRHFSLKTVIKITHKMKFVMNCDKVLVVDNGKIVEYDTPNVLLSNRNSLFYKMIEKSDVK